MKTIRPLLPLFALSITLSSTYAATEYDGAVPAEVVTQLIGAAFGGGARLYSDAPEGFPPFEMPRGMNFLVGVDQGWSQRVILRSRVDHQASIALAYGALLDAGWQLVPRPGSQPQTSGFIDPRQSVPQTQLCHDRYGLLEISTQGGPGATYVNINRNVQQGMQPQTCAQVVAGAQPMPQNIPPEIALRQQQYLALQQHLPRLELPDTDGMTAPRGGYGGGGGSDNEWEVRAMLTGNWRMRRIYNHFAEQIEDQGWDRDARTVGDTTASGSWTKAVDDLEFVGSLTVVMTANETYDLRFRMIRIGEGAGANVRGLGIRGIQPGLASPIGVSQSVRD